MMHGKSVIKIGCGYSRLGRVLREILELRGREGVIGECRKLSGQQLHDLHSSKILFVR